MGPFGNLFGMGMGPAGLAEMMAQMMGEGNSSDMNAISIDPDALNEYPKWVQESVRKGKGHVKKDKSPQEIVQKIETDAVKKQLKEAMQMLYSTLLRVEGLKERLAEAAAAQNDADKSHREKISALRGELREAKRMTSIKAEALKKRGKTVQDLRAINKRFLTDLARQDKKIAALVVVDSFARNLCVVINSINVNGTKPELQETINTLKLAVADIPSADGSNGADAEQQ